MSTIFISDLHLSTKTAKTSHIFLTFLQQQAVNAEKLYILGDFFELWIGDDNVTTFSKTIQNALQQAAQHTSIFFMHGNRDFLIGQDFAKQANITLLPDPCIIDLYSEKVLLMHGDLLCTDDTTYQQARKKFHHSAYQKMLLNKPLWQRKLYAKYLQYKSYWHKRHASIDIMDVNQEAVNQAFEKYAVNTLIHGHTHRPGIQINYRNKKPHQRIVLSDWHHHGNALVCSPTGAKRLIYFS